MTVNERWVVYPLLFLSLGVAMRDKMVPPDEVAANWRGIESVAEEARAAGVEAEPFYCDLSDSNAIDMMVAAVIAFRICTPMCPRPPTPMTTAVVPGVSFGSERRMA